MRGSVYHRRQIKTATQRCQANVEDVAFRLFDMRFKSLKRELRQSNLRKRLAKSDGMLVEKREGTWSEWIDAFDSKLTQALIAGGEWIDAATEDQFEKAKKGRSKEAVAAYQRRRDHSIKDIAKSTEKWTNKVVREWYGGKEKLPKLIERLSGRFSRERARLIAITETTYLSSEIAHAAMVEHGVKRWQWDAFDDACPKCRALMERSRVRPFTLKDPMPPDRSHPNCVCRVYMLD